MELQIREATPDDRERIFKLNAAAFPTDAEARLVDALRDAFALTLSLVAVREGELLGHVGFSPVRIASADGAVRSAVGLAPLAVAPAWRRRGVGGRLIEAGLQRLRARGEPLCVVLGEPALYVRHGFVPAAAHGLRWERAVPDEVFLVHRLHTDGSGPIAGVVRYRPEFDLL